MPDPNNPLDPVQSSFFYANAPANSPLSYQSLLTRRKIAEALLSKRTALPFPKNLGEGLTYASDRLANAFDDRTMLDRLDAAERVRQAQLDKFAAGPVPGSEDVPNIPASGRPQALADESGDTSGVPPVPYVPSGEGSVPLPPPRPIVDRSPIINDANDPVTARRQAAITLGEANPGASQAELQTQYATAPDRALATGTSLPNAIKTYTGPRSGGYYPADAIARGEQMLAQPGAYESFQERVARPVLRGADPGRGMFGFTPTQNASLGVASRGAANGTYSQFARSPTGELFARKPGERPPTPFPAGGPDLGGPDVAGTPPDATEQGRNAITGAVLAGAQPPAPNARVASLGGGGPLGNAGAASAVIPPALPPTTPPVPYANPPTPTDIQPRPQIAQARPPGIPGPLTPPTPTPTPPPAPGTPQGFKPPPPAPVLDTRPTPEEVHGIRMLRQYPDDPAFAAEAQRWIAAGQAKRQAAFEQQKENHKNLMEDWKLGQAAAIAQQNPAEQLKLQEARQEAQRKQAEYEHFGGQTLEQAKAPVVESYKEASKLPAMAIELRNAKEAVPKMFTGRTADIQLELAKWGAAAGLPLNPKIAPTEAFKSYITGVVGQLRPLVVGAGAQSNAELQFLQKAAGADAKLDQKSITSILNSVEKLTTMAGIEHQKKLLTFTGDDPNRQRAFGGYNVMEHVVPQAAVNTLREHAKEDPAAAAKEFDEYYYMPGLAAKILRSGR